MIIGGSGYGKTNSLFNLTNYRLYTDNIYLYAKGLFKAKYIFLIIKQSYFALPKEYYTKYCTLFYYESSK